MFVKFYCGVNEFFVLHTSCQIMFVLHVSNKWRISIDNAYKQHRLNERWPKQSLTQAEPIVNDSDIISIAQARYDYKVSEGT